MKLLIGTQVMLFYLDVNHGKRLTGKLTHQDQVSTAKKTPPQNPETDLIKISDMILSMCIILLPDVVDTLQLFNMIIIYFLERNICTQRYLTLTTS